MKSYLSELFGLFKFGIIATACGIRRGFLQLLDEIIDYFITT